MKKILFSGLLLLTLGFSTTVLAADKLTVLLDWFLNPDHAPLFVAEEKGFFAKQNLEVKLIGPADPSDPPKLVAAKQADIAITYQPEFMEQVDEGLPLVMIGTLINNPLNTVVVMKDGPIHTTRDLAGKKIGYSGSSKNHVLVKILLEQDHLSLDTVTLINVRHGLTQALLSGKVDAITGVMRNFEIPQIELAGKAVRTFDPEKNGMPTYSELIFVVHYPRADDTRYARFLRALAEGVAYLRQHPEETWRDFAKANPELNNELNRRAWFATLPYFAAKPTAFNAGAFMRYAEFMRQRGLIKSIQPQARYTTIKE